MLQFSSKYLFLLLLLSNAALAELTPVRLLLKWDHQYQFSGYYAAQWQGFYEEVGLDVSFIPRPKADGTLQSISKGVQQSGIEFALAGPDLLQYIDEGMEFVLVSSMYQRSPFKFFVRADSDIYTAVDLHSACIETSGDFGELELKTLFKKEGLSTEEIRWSKFNFGLQSLQDKSCDVVIDYDASGSWAAKEKNMQVRKISAEQFGIKFYGDVLFSSKKLVDRDPDLVERFKKASIKGWHYALDNPIVMSEKINKNLARVLKFNDELGYHHFSSNITKTLMNYPMVEVGHSSIERWRQIQEDLYEVGALKNRYLPSWFLFDYSTFEKRTDNRLIIIIVAVALLLFIVLFILYLNMAKRKKSQDIELLGALEDHEVLRTVINLLPMSVFWKNSDSKYLGCNQSFLSSTGLKDERDLIGKSDHEMPWSDKAGEYIDDDIEVLNVNNPEQAPYEIQYDLDSGGSKWFLARKVAIKNNQKEILGVVGAYQDITEYKNANEQLELQRISSVNLLSRMKGLINSSPDMIYYKDYKQNEGRYIVCNAFFEEWVGTLESELQGKTDFEVFDKSVAEKYQQEDLTVIGNRKELRKEESIETASGKSILYEFTKVPVYTSEGDIDGLLCVGKDITKKRELESINEVLFTVTNDAYFILGVDGAVVNCNDKAMEYLGMDHKANMIGLKLIRDFSPEFQPSGETSKELADISNEQLSISKNGYHSTSFVHKNIDGELLYMDVFLAKIGNGHMLVQWHDISESKEKQIKLEQAKKEAEDLANTKSLFLANMSHEIRTPLNAIVGLGGLLSKNNDPDKSKLYVDSINQSSHHLLNVINDILDFSKIEANKMSIELVAVDIKELIDSVKSMYDRQANEAGIDLLFQSHDLPSKVMTDPTKLKQVLTNLVSNAIKFTSHGSVSIGGSMINEKLELWVKDSGIGIASDRMSQLFEPFTQEDISTTRKFGGTGLGLSICKGLTEIMGGEIHVESDAGKGTVFTVVLPCVILDVLGQDDESVLSLDLTGKRILIAEDNVLNQLVIEELLLETNVDVKIVDNGQLAVDALKSSTFDLILMDIQMPVLDGIRATEKIRATGDVNIPIIALTANTGEAERKTAMNSGMSDFMTKPIDQEILFKVLAKWLSIS